MAPKRCAQKLCEGEGGNDNADDQADAKMHSQHIDAGTAQRLHIKRQQRNDHQQPEHVDEGRGHQCEKFGGNLPHFAPQHVKQATRDRAECY